ncbi:MAG: hypothetical protein ACXIVQ_05075 [Acidimicrobiales bacterium]
MTEGDSSRADERGMRSVAGQLRGATLAVGIGTALALVVPATLASVALVDTDGDDGGGALGLLFVALILVGFGLGGRTAARTAAPLPITHGAFVGLITFTLVQAGALLVSSLAGREGDINTATIVIGALMACSAGMIGASFGRRGSHWR